MPVIDEDREREKEEKSKKSSGPGAATKTKDLSHVPCKFFKVGSCTAGSSCPFSHEAIGPGVQKEVCAWFVKGNNCKFGHKCALAHVLPGQSMSMDRKNKKLAQQQAQAAKEGKEVKETKEGREGKGRKRDAQQARPPTMSLKSLKASISPSAPAPALNDTDFTSFSALEPDKLPTASAANGKQSKSDAETTTTELQPKKDFGPIGSPPRNTETASTSPGTPTNNNTLSTSPYRQSVLRSPSGPGGTNSTRAGLSMNRSTSSGNSGGATLGAGISGGKNPSWGSMGNGSDIGSLPSLPSALLRPLNAIQPHTSNTPASGTQASGKDFDLTFEYDELLGNGPGRGVTSSAVVIEDNADGDLDDLDDFLPSSLTDLLTPEERKRRMSRSNSSQQETHSGLASPQSYSSRRTLGVPLASRVEDTSTPGGSSVGHRYSRSVPMSDLSHLWANQDQNPIPSPNSNANNISSSFTGPSSFSAGSLGGGLPSSPPRRIGNGTPASFTSASGRLAADDYYPYTGGGSPNSAALGMSALNPSNASAAFLPGYGFGTAYIKAKREHEAAAAAAAANGAAQRSVSGGILTNSRMATNTGMPGTSPSGSGMGYATPRKEPTGPVTAAPFGPSAIGAPREIGGMGSMERGMGLSGLGGLNGMDTAVSPSTRAALQNHAPGQSLPQGLAAGLSRIHAKTSMQVGSLTSVGSPPAGSTGLSPGLGGLSFYSGPYGTNLMSEQQQSSQSQVSSGLGGSGLYGQQYGNSLGQQAQPQKNQAQIQARYNPLSSQGLGTAPGSAAATSDFDAMFSKLALTPQAPSAALASTQTSSPLSYANAAAGSTSGSGTSQKSVSTRGTNGGHDDDLFDMDEEA